MSKGWYGWVRTSRQVGLSSQLGDWTLPGWPRGGTGHANVGTCGTSLPRANRSCHYLFRPPVEGSPKMGLVPAAVVVASKIALLQARTSLGHPGNKCSGRGTPRIPAP